MKTEIGIVRGATKEEVLSKKFIIYMGISLNNKWFTKENMGEYILWGLKHTKERFCIEIADTLQAINYKVRSKYTEKAAIRKALKEGDKFIEIINEIISKLPEKDKKRIDVIRWKDVKADIDYKSALPVFQKEFETNKNFREAIKNIVKDFGARLEQPPMREEKIEKLCEYIVEELPQLINGFTFNRTYYNCLIYPSDALLLQLIEQIQRKEKFPELHNKLKIKNNVFVELKVNL